MIIYMMFLRLILSFGDTGVLLLSEGSVGCVYSDGSCMDAGLAAALMGVGKGTVGSTIEWNGGRARCGTLAGADWGRE